jgi:ABC-type nitrate/sulfonate/bicarbonate transport system ATPase subunit
LFDHGGGPTAGALRMQGVAKAFSGAGDPRPVLDDLTLSVAAGEFCALVGPSGSGKSTILNLFAGLVEPDVGRVEVLGRTGAAVLGAAAYMPQRDALMPWRTVEDNVALPLRIAGVPGPEARTRARALLERFGLGAYARARPDSLSGGMRQRVAFLRTVLPGRGALLLDEPFGALDALTRAELQDWLQAAAVSERQSVLLVTHDVEEALYLADRVVVLRGRPGRLVLDLAVPWPRPRRREVTLSTAFSALKGELYAALGVGASVGAGAREASGHA